MRDAIERAAVNNALRQQRLEKTRQSFGSTPTAGSVLFNILSTPEQNQIEQERLALQPQIQEADKQYRSQMAQDIEAVTGQKVNPDNFDTPTFQAIYKKVIESKATPSASDSPSAVKEYNFFQKLSPEQQQGYMNLKRADPLRAKGLVDNAEGGVAPIQGYASGRQQIMQAEESGKQAAKLQYEPTIEGNKAKAKSDAEFRAKAQQSLPQSLESADYLTTLLDGLKSSPGKSYAVGKSSVLPIVPGTDAADFMAKFEQVGGKQFLQAFESLKGGGQITEIEGQKATQAIARMQRSQTEKEFDASVDEFKGIVEKAKKRARAAAGGGLSEYGNSANDMTPAEKAASLIENVPTGQSIMKPTDYKSKYGLE